MLMALAYQDKHTITMLSAMHNAGTTTISRIVRGGQQEDIEKPVVIYDYTAHMGAVDRSDHYCTSYSFMQKSLKWWRKMFFWLVEVSTVNSFVLYKKVNHTTTLQHLTYRQKLVEQLVGDIIIAANNGAGQVLLIVKKGSTSSLISLQRLHEGLTKIAWYAARHNPEKQLCFLAKLAPESLGYTLKHTKQNYKQ